MRIGVFAYTRICVYAYWADACYAYILVRIYLSCTVHVHEHVFLEKHMKIGNKIETIFEIKNFVSFKIKQMLNNKFIKLWW